MIDPTGGIWDVETTDTDGESIYIVSDLCAMNDDAIAKVGTLIDATLIVKCVNAHDGLVNALRDLLAWGRDHTSPRDADSPHALLVAAAAALARVTP
jgi:hypothetical protein